MARLLWLSLGLVSCGSFGAGDDSGGMANDPCDREPALDWDNFGKGYMELHCVGCHSSLLPSYLREGAPVGVDFNTYQDVLRQVDRIEARATGEDPTMPPAGGPSTQERALLDEWLMCRVRPDLELVEE